MQTKQRRRSKEKLEKKTEKNRKKTFLSYEVSPTVRDHNHSKPISSTGRSGCS